MLDKSVCIQCINTRRQADVKGETIAPWNWEDEADWNEEGQVACDIPFMWSAYDERGHYGSVHKEPPSWCAFKLEHIINYKGK